MHISVGLETPCSMGLCVGTYCVRSSTALVHLLLFVVFVILRFSVNGRRFGRSISRFF